MKSLPVRAAQRRFLRHGLLPQLAAFEAVVRLGSASRAAEALCIAPSTLSGHLGKLSDALGVRLFELQGKQLVPTPAALPLLAAVDEVFDAFARCEQALVPLREARRSPWQERVEAPALVPVPR